MLVKFWEIWIVIIGIIIAIGIIGLIYTYKNEIGEIIITGLFYLLGGVAIISAVVGGFLSFVK